MVLVLLVSSIQSFGYDSLRIENREGRAYIIHQVDQGETLYALSRRYEAQVQAIVEENNIVDNTLSLGQELWIPYEGQVTVTSERTDITHVVQMGETLFALSRKYGSSVDELKTWNNLSSNELSIGDQLIVSKGDSSVNAKTDDQSVVRTENVVVEKAPESSIPKGFTQYAVQNGELLESIASKFKVKPDSIVIWNDLTNTYLSIGQKLLIKGEVDKSASSAVKVKKTAYGSIRKQTDSSGFTKIYEEGVASKIESSVETEKYLALHRNLSIGSLIEVRNLMNNKKVFVRVVGNLPETGLNEKVLIRLTPVCFERLGVIDPKTRVEVSYYQD